MRLNSRYAKRLVVFYGLVASGKSYLGTRWAKHHGCRYHNTDVVRKELAAATTDVLHEAGHTLLNESIYSRSMTRKTYDALIGRARADLADPELNCVVLDGSFLDKQEQGRVISACSTRADIFFIYCFCSETSRKTRLQIRQTDPEAVSDGRWEIYRAQKKRFGGPEPVGGARLLELGTERPLNELMEAVDVFVGLR